MMMNEGPGRPRVSAQGYYPSYGNENDDVSLLGTMLGALFCLLLFCVIIASVAYPMTMYKESPGAFSDEKWWCYHCMDPSFCGAKCW